MDEYGNDAGLVSSGYVGEIKMFGFAGVPAHCLACDGSLLSIAAYPELYAKLGTMYGGDGVTTFALPTAEDVIYAAGNGRAVGAAVADGLPNITGELEVAQIQQSNGQFSHGVLWGDSGALNISTTTLTSGPSGIVISNGVGQQSRFILALDASRSSAIYGASSHVQPKGTAFNVCIVYE